MPSLHQYLTRLPSDIDPSTWEEIIHRASNLFERHHPDTLEQLNARWLKKWFDRLFLSMLFWPSLSSETLAKTPVESFSSRSTNGDVDLVEQQGALPRIVLWGVTLTISGLAIYIWNHTQRTDPTTLISLGDFLAQLYRHWSSLSFHSRIRL